MSSVINFGDRWHDANPEGIPVDLKDAWRHINILSESGLGSLASLFARLHPVTSYVLTMESSPRDYLHINISKFSKIIPRKDLLKAVEVGVEYRVIGIRQDLLSSEKKIKKNLPRIYFTAYGKLLYPFLKKAVQRLDTAQIA